MGELMLGQSAKGPPGHQRRERERETSQNEVLALISHPIQDHVPTMIDCSFRPEGFSMIIIILIV